jgi:lytic murein transglycosylase
MTTEHRTPLSMRTTGLKLTLSALAVVLAGPAFASGAKPPANSANCQNTGSFEAWAADFRKEAIAKGIPPQIVAAAARDFELDANVIKKDRSQSVFSQSFLQFQQRMISDNRMRKAADNLQKNAALFARVEKDFGVPPVVLTAFWGLESDFGAITGNFRLIKSLATLAYDCRRPDFFRAELFDALRIVQRGDQTIEGMNGNWAGEFGAMQITASDSFANAVDYDGDGRRDLINSVPDTLATAANFLKSLGWKRGEPWLQEVRVPADMPWQEADLEIQHPVSKWAAWGVKPANGKLPSGAMQASLVLPMGRLGPAFLAYPNFKAFLGWNSAIVYSTTVAYFATRLEGAPPVGRGNGEVVVLSPQQMMELQRALTARGDDIGEIDGKLGSKTRAAVKQAQIKFNLPADSYPSLELIEKLKVQTGAR